MSRRPTPARLPFTQLSPSSAVDFARACRAVTLAVSKDTRRPLLTGVHIVTMGSTIRVEGTDSYRLHRVDVDTLDIDGYPAPLPAYEAVVPAHFLKLLPDKPRNIHVTGVRLDLPANGDQFGWCHNGETYTTATIRDADYLEAHGRLWVDSDAALALADTPKTDRKALRAFNPKYLADIARASGILFPDGYPAAIVKHLEPMKPARFDITDHEESLVRMTAIIGAWMLLELLAARQCDRLLEPLIDPEGSAA